MITGAVAKTEMMIGSPTGCYQVKLPAQSHAAVARIKNRITARGRFGNMAPARQRAVSVVARRIPPIRVVSTNAIHNRAANPTTGRSTSGRVAARLVPVGKRREVSSARPTME